MAHTEFNIEALPVNITYVRETKRNDDWKCDQWSVELAYAGGYWTTDYFTGIGFRGPMPKPNDGGPMPRKGSMMYAELESLRKPVKPSVASVLHSLFLDASAANYNFDSWCDEYGYSSDSISALNIYKQCLDTATRLRKAFDADTRTNIEAVIGEM